jgi:hypothetical protein
VQRLQCPAPPRNIAIFPWFVGSSRKRLAAGGRFESSVRLLEAHFVVRHSGLRVRWIRPFAVSVPRAVRGALAPRAREGGLGGVEPAHGDRANSRKLARIAGTSKPLHIDELHIDELELDSRLPIFPRPLVDRDPPAPSPIADGQ